MADWSVHHRLRENSWGNGGGAFAGREWLKPLQDHLSDAGLGHISEIFDGDAPHRPCGCIAQAWSVGEVLRAYVEEVKGVRAGRVSDIISRALPSITRP